MRTTQQDKDKFIEALKITLGNISAACELTKIKRFNYYHWIENDEKFKQDCLDIENIQFDFVENALMKNIKDGKEQSAIFYLKTKGRNRGYGSELNINANINGKIDIKDLFGFDDDENN